MCSNKFRQWTIAERKRWRGQRQNHLRLGGDRHRRWGRFNRRLCRWWAWCDRLQRIRCRLNRCGCRARRGRWLRWSGRRRYWFEGRGRRGRTWSWCGSWHRFKRISRRWCSFWRRIWWHVRLRRLFRFDSWRSDLRLARNLRLLFRGNSRLSVWNIVQDRI